MAKSVQGMAVSFGEKTLIKREAILFISCNKKRTLCNTSKMYACMYGLTA